MHMQHMMENHCTMVFGNNCMPIWNKVWKKQKYGKKYWKLSMELWAGKHCYGLHHYVFLHRHCMSVYAYIDLLSQAKTRCPSLISFLETATENRLQNDQRYLVWNGHRRFMGNMKTRRRHHTMMISLPIYVWWINIKMLKLKERFSKTHSHK